MNAAHMLQNDARMKAAIDEMQTLIRQRYPTATFSVDLGDDPDGVYVTATVDVDDTDEVMDVYLDRLIELHIEQGLPLYVIPVRTPERIAAYYRQQQLARRPTTLAR